MRSRLAAALVGAALLTAAACSSTSTTATTTTTAGGGVTTTTAAASTTTKAGGSSSKIPAKPATIEKVDRSKLPAKAQSAPSSLDLSQDESDCIDYVVFLAVTDDPTLATDDAKLAGLLGGSVVACVPQPKIAAALGAALKAFDTTSKLTDEQIACVQKEIAAAAPEALALFIGVLAYQDQSMIQPFQDELAKACNIAA